MRDDDTGSLADQLVDQKGYLRITVGDILVALARSVGVVALTVLAYVALPVRAGTTVVAAAVGAAAGMAVVGVVFVRQLGRISRAPRPTLAAVEALSLVFGVFVTMQALIYVSLSAGDPAAFTEPLDKADGLYFAVTVLTTVGFGDITALTTLARGVVTFQMVVNLVLLGTAVKLLTSSTRQAIAARRSEAGPGRTRGRPAGPSHRGSEQA